ncbi:MAG: heme lyase CcmF/NrfE family subunit, partial [Ilumatobacter sp.]
RAIAEPLLFAWPALLGTVLSVAMMQIALAQRDYSIEFVQQVGSSTTPTLYNVAAMWSALEGSILLWVLVLVVFTAAVALRFRSRRDDPLVAWALVVMYVVTTFFALISFGPASPFAAGESVRVGFAGGGPVALLQIQFVVVVVAPVGVLG